MKASVGSYFVSPFTVTWKVCEVEPIGKASTCVLAT